MFGRRPVLLGDEEIYESEAGDSHLKRRLALGERRQSLRQMRVRLSEPRRSKFDLAQGSFGQTDGELISVGATALVSASSAVVRARSRSPFMRYASLR